MQFHTLFLRSTTRFHPGTAVTASTPIDVAHTSLPYNLYWNDFVLDGFLMGWVGGAVNSNFSNITLIRYSDLQNSLANDPDGLYVGGLGNWFSPPHGFYIFIDPSVAFYGVYSIFTNILDEGVYVGVVTRRSISSGFLHSLKTSLSNGTRINGYISNRPDGMFQVDQDGGANGYAAGMVASYVSTTNTATNSGAAASGTQAITFPAVTNPSYPHAGRIFGSDCDGFSSCSRRVPYRKCRGGERRS